MNSMEIRPVAHIENEYREKFGIPRQSGLNELVLSRIVFEPEYRDLNALRGIEDFDYIWLIWGFSGNSESSRFSPTVKPPKLGGNTRMGVFATRAPFRPNRLGLSSVRLLEVKQSDVGPVLIVSGADLMDGTPIYDIKPYLPYTDSHQDARAGFTEDMTAKPLEVLFDCDTEGMYQDYLDRVQKMLSLDPRPGYSGDGAVYGIHFGDRDVRFSVENGVCRVTEIAPEDSDKIKNGEE